MLFFVSTAWRLDKGGIEKGVLGMNTDTGFGTLFLEVATSLLRVFETLIGE
jgi:hypothetical protein